MSLVELQWAWKAEYLEVCRAFFAREIDEAAYRLKMAALGFDKYMIEAEVALHHPPSPGVPIRA